MKTEVRSLTGIRGIAAMYVVCYHVVEGIGSHAAAHNWLVAFFYRGYLAVDLFFVLSGFVMALTYARLFEGAFTGWAVFTFLSRRVARVWPVAMVGTAVGALALMVTTGIWHISPVWLLLDALMVNGWGIGRPIDLPLWSVSAEFLAYLTFPITLAIVFRSRPAAAIGMVIAYGLVVLAATFGRTPDSVGPLDVFDTRTAWPLLRCLGGFVLGLLCYRLGRSPNVAAAICSGPVATWASAALLVALAAGVNDLVIYPLFPAIVLGLARDRGVAARFLASPAVYVLGVLSYSIYAVHGPILQLVRFGLHPGGTTASGTVGSIVEAVAGLTAVLLAATLTNRLIERPASRRIRRAAEALAARAGQVAAG